MQKTAILTANALLGGGFMGENQGRALKNEQDMLALAEELAARFPAAAAGNRKEGRLKPWMVCGLSAVGGAGVTGLLWWISLMG